MVTPTNGTCTFLNRRTGALEKANIYIADAVGTKVKFSTMAKAATTDNAYVQFKDPVTLVDVSILTGPTVIFALVPTSGGTPIPSRLVAIADQLNTLPSRTPINLMFGAGSMIGFNEA
jgi:hypothetical protein